MTNSQLDMFKAYSSHKKISNKSFKFIDLFAGIGGFRQAFEAANYECVFSSEINEHCQKVYKDNFKEDPFPDVADINAEKLPDFQILLAGFPCQPFSICGKKKGFEDTRGTLFFDICRIIDDYFQPLSLHLSLTERVSIMIRGGYVGRNPKTGDLQKHLQNGVMTH